MAELRSSGGVDAINEFSGGTVEFERFSQGLQFFVRSQSQFLSHTPLGDPWIVPLTSAEQCRFQSRENIPITEAHFRNLRFIGSSHLQNETSERVSSASAQLRQRLIEARPDVLILEGYKYGRPLPCEIVLRSVLNPDDTSGDERAIAEKYGFLNRIALAGGDSMTVEDSDLPTLFRGNSQALARARQDMEFIEGLHQYRQALRDGTPNPLERALAAVATQVGGTTAFSNSTFRSMYRELNQRELPTDPETIYSDVIPSNFLRTPPRGTNQLSLKAGQIRDQALLRTIQIASERYARPTVVYGSGHLADLGPTLERQLGPATNTNFRNTCR